jgi:6-phosphofructokinase 1
MSKKIGILTSGGDAPGMNAAICGAIHAGIHAGYEMYVVNGGYYGLIHNDFKKVEIDFADSALTKGGTIIYTRRLPEFKEESVRQIAVDNLKKEGIDALIVIGGDGSYMGAKKLTEMGINCVGIPGTIDNDIASSDFTVGFDTALNTVCEAIDKIRETADSHKRCIICEVMGNKCPDLTLYAGIATDADYIITVDKPLDEKDLLKVLNEKYETQDSAIVLLAEKQYSLEALTKLVSENTPWDTRNDILGYIQRGGSPSAMERVNAIRMGKYAIDLLGKGIGGVCVGLDGTELVHRDIFEALALPRNKHEDLYEVFESIK